MGYTIEEIRHAREYIRRKMIDVLSDKGGENFASLNGKNIEMIFDLYDEVFFQGQIREKLQEEGAIIDFFARSRKSGVAGLCGRKYIDGAPYYYFDIAPNVLNDILKYNPNGMPLAAGVGCGDRLACLQIIIEHEIIHLLSMLWEYAIFRKDDAEYDIYGPHGLLFQCMIREYFGHTRYNHIALTQVINIEEPNVIKNKLPNRFVKYMNKNPQTYGGFDNWSNSCYIDSVLMVMLECISPYWRKNIMDTDTNQLDYSQKVRDENKIVQLRHYAGQIQEEMEKDYKLIHLDKKTTKCINVRSILTKVAPRMKEQGKWVLFNAGTLYDAIVDVFPNLSLDIPVQIHRWITSDTDNGRYLSDPIEYRSESSLLMWDFLDPLTDVEEKRDYKEIRWDIIDSPALVFYNGAAPRIRDFGTRGREKGYIYIRGDQSNKLHKHEFDVVKAREFGLTILDGRYRLVGVVVLEGVSPINEGGSHYTSYFLGTDERWYHYDDVGARVNHIEELPQEGVWKEARSRMPSMYFYQKVKQPEPEKIPRKKQTSTPSSSRKVEICNGTSLDYKKITTKTVDETDYMYYVTDKTKGYVLSQLLDKIQPHTIVDESNRLRLWLVKEGHDRDFEAKLKDIDRKASEIIKVSEVKKVCIDAVDLGGIYKSYRVGDIINYSAKSFIVLSNKIIPQLPDPLILKNLEYGLKGIGHLYPKSKLQEIQTILTKL